MKKGHILLLIAILALGAFLRFYDITEIPLGLYPDEAMNGNNALEANASGQYKVFYPENNGREGLFINLQAISLAIFGNDPWALRVVSAILGTLTILGIYLVAKELFRSENQEARIKDQVNNENYLILDSKFLTLDSSTIALLAAFFTATSYWHVNFSRIGFRAIMLPLIACFAMYFLLKGLRTGKIPHLVVAGILAGLGFYTYIAYRFMVFAALVPIIWHLWQWRRSRKTGVSSLQPTIYNLQSRLRAPYAVSLFLFFTFLAALPIGIYFLHNPQDFSNRAGAISIFSASSPLKESGVSAIKTIGMLFMRGDCNWRHNFACQPELHPLVALFSIIGIMITVHKISLQPKTYNLKPTFLLVWLVAMALPAILTREGIPHALRSIGMIPPIMIFSGLGAASLWSATISWLEKQKTTWPQREEQLIRIRRELLTLCILILLIIPLSTYRTYFILWAENDNTYEAFDTSSLHLGQFLKTISPETKKYVLVNTKGVLVRGIPMPAETVMFLTDTFREGARAEKNITYLAGSAIENNIAISPGERALVALMDGRDHELIRAIQKKYPTLKEKAPGDFVVLQNY